MIVKETHPGDIYSRKYLDLSDSEKERIKEICEELRSIFNEDKKVMTIKDHIENLDYIMDSMPDDACGDWRDSIAYAIENLQEKMNNGDTIDQIKKEFIDLYPKNYMGGLELDGCSCEFSLNQILKILDKYKKGENHENN